MVIGMESKRASALISSSTDLPSRYGRFQSKMTSCGVGARRKSPAFFRNRTASMPSRTTCRVQSKAASANAARTICTSAEQSSTSRTSNGMAENPVSRRATCVAFPDYHHTARATLRKVARARGKTGMGVFAVTRAAARLEKGGPARTTGQDLSAWEHPISSKVRFNGFPHLKENRPRLKSSIVMQINYSLFYLNSPAAGRILELLQSHC